MTNNPKATEFFSADDLPEADPATAQTADDAIMARHVLATLRTDSPTTTSAAR